MAGINFGDAFIDPKDFGAGVNELVGHITKLEKSFDRLGVEVETGAKKKIQDLSKAIRELNIVEKDAQKTLLSYQQQLQKASRINSELAEKVRENKKQLAEARREVERMRKAAAELTNSQRALADNTEKTTKASKRSAMGMIEMAKTYLRTTVTVTLLYQGLRDVIQGVKDSYQSMIDFDQSMKAVEAITRSTSSQIQRLTQDAKNLGATTEYTALQVSQLQKELGKLGFAPQEIISATGAIIDLATATGEDLTESAKIAASTLRAFDLDASETERITSVMAGSFVRSGLNLQSFGQAMKFVAPAAEKLNIDVETTTVLMSKLADAGLRGTQAGTSLRNIFSDLADPTSKLAQRLEFTVGNSEELIKAFQKLTAEGVEFADIAGLVDLTARQQFATFIKHANQLDDIQKEYRELEFEGKRLAFMMRDTLANDIAITGSAFDALGRNVFTFLDQLGQTDKTASNFRNFQQEMGGYIQRLSNQLEEAGSSWEKFSGFSAALMLPLLDVMMGVNGEGELFSEWTKGSLNNLVVASKNAYESTKRFTDELEAVQRIFEEDVASGKLVEGTNDYIVAQKEVLKAQEDVTQAYASNSNELAIVENMLKEYEKGLETVAEVEATLTAAELIRYKSLRNQQTVLGWINQAYLEHNYELIQLAKNLKNVNNNFGGKDVVDYGTQITKLKAETEAYVATLEKQAQFQDKTLVQQARTAEKIAAKRIADIREENRLRLLQIEETKGQLNDTVVLQQQETENLKAQTAITKIQIGLQNELRNLRQRQANLTNRELLAEINLEMRKNQIVKDNVLNTYDDRLRAAKRYYGENATLIQTNEDREIQILNRKFEDNLIAEEDYQVELLEITTKYAEQKMINGRQSRDEIFKLEQEDFARRLKIRQEFEQLALADQASSNKVNQIEAENRMRMIDLDMRMTKFQFGERKRLLQEQQQLQLNLVSQQAALEKAQAENAFKNKIITLRQELERGEKTQEEFEQLRLQNLQAFSNRVKEINAQTGASIEQIQVETGLSIRDNWIQTFQEIADFTLQLTDSLFSIIDQKRQAELASLKRWEDSRLEYVKGNAEAEALVRAEAERKRVAIERKQAKDARKKALFDIALNTAVAITKVMPNPLAITLVSILGAAQTAAVLASPLPEFAKGTKNAPEGYAKVDERGQELIYRRKQRKLELGQKSGERITHLDRGDQVFTAAQTKQILKGDDTILPNQNMFNKVINVNSTSTRPTDEDKIIEGVSRAIKQITIEQSSFDERGFTKFIKTKSSRTQLLNKRYKF